MTILKHNTMHSFNDLFYYRRINEDMKALFTYYANALLKEATNKHYLRFLHDKALYRQFKENELNEEECANKHLCKYFKVKMYMKAIRLVLGENKFTDEDIEMFNYFNKHQSMLGTYRKSYAFTELDSSCRSSYIVNTLNIRQYYHLQIDTSVLNRLHSIDKLFTLIDITLLGFTTMHFDDLIVCIQNFK